VNNAHSNGAEEDKGFGFRSLFRTKRDLWYLGLACPQVWLNYMFQSLNPTAPLSTEVFYATRGFFLLLVAAVFFVRRYSRDVTGAGLFSWIIVAAMTLAPFIATYAPFLPREAAGLVAALFGGMGIVWSYLPHVQVYSKLEAKRIAGYVLASFALASVIRLAINLLPFDLALVAAMPFPVLGMIMAQRALSHTRSRPPDASRTEGMRKLVPIALELAVYGIVVGMVRLSSESLQYEWFASMTHLVFRTAFPLLLLWCVFARHISISLSRLLQIALLAVITALLFISLFGSTTSPISVAATTNARTAIIILLWLSLALLARRSSYHPYIVFGIGWALYMLSIAAGMLIGQAIEAATVSAASFGLNLVYFLVVSTVFALLLRNEGQTKLLSSAEDERQVLDLAFIDARCEEIGASHRLTRREVEVMQMICKGRSKSHIAQAFSISEHTVSGYAKNLYTKLDVHSKQDLLSLLGIP
jgi:DNA-binding CsgD family transcriptional regulator